MSGQLNLFDERIGRNVDALYAVLVATDELQLFPELYEIFGKNAVVKFLDLFAGQTIVVPPRDVLEAKIRDITMWSESLQGGNASIVRLAKEYNLTEDQVRDAIRGITEALERVGVVACNTVRSAGVPSAL